MCVCVTLRVFFVLFCLFDCLFVCFCICVCLFVRFEGTLVGWQTAGNHHCFGGTPYFDTRINGLHAAGA